MPGQTEYDVFKFLYEEENRRFAELSNRAKVFLSVVSLVLGSLFLKLDVVLSLATGHLFVTAVLFLAWTSMFLAIVTTIMSLRVRDYEGICDPEAAAESLDKLASGDSDDDGAQGAMPENAKREFLADGIADLAVATNRNTKQNDIRARYLELAGNFLVAGFAFAFLFLISAVITSENADAAKQPQRLNQPDKLDQVDKPDKAKIGNDASNIDPKAEEKHEPIPGPKSTPNTEIGNADTKISPAAPDQNSENPK